MKSGRKVLFSMLPQLLNHSPDLQQLRDEGYNIEVRSNYLLLKDVPYVTAQRTVARGIIVSELTTSGNATARPGNHVVSFVGAIPCDNNGNDLDDIINQKHETDLGGGLLATCTFSSKPPEGYGDYFAKMTTYASMLAGHAQVIEPGVSAKTYPPSLVSDDESVFRYTDSASSRAQLGALSEKLKIDKVAIVGLGGTGSYILDLIAKTPVQYIHLYDGDTFYTHNAFRAPGAALIDELSQAPKKVDYFQREYDHMRRNIVPHAAYVTAANVDELKDMGFVFLSVDGGSAKELIVKKLEEFGVPFIDTGIGVYEGAGSLAGIVRTTTSTKDKREHVWEKVDFADGQEDVYDRNVQVADLNVLNAVMAVIKWKKLCGFYADLEREYSSSYTINGNHLLNEDQAA